VLNQTSHHVEVWGSGAVAARIHNLGTRWRGVVSFTPRKLYYAWRSPWYPLDWRLGGPQSRSGRDAGERNFQHLPGI